MRRALPVDVQGLDQLRVCEIAKREEGGPAPTVPEVDGFFCADPGCLKGV